ncbi:surfactant protein Ba [Aulostomus maculatus]
MALFKFALLFCLGLQGYGLTDVTDGLKSPPDALAANGDPCQDCTQIFELLVDLLSNAGLQKDLIDDLESLCDHLPGPVTTSQLCKQEVEKLLPVVLNFLTGFVKPGDICRVMGLCGSCDKQKMLSHFVNKALQMTKTNENVKPTSQCSICILLIKTLDELLPKERTEDAVIKLLGEICHILPMAYRNQCQFVIGKFSRTVLDAILSYATPQTVCSLIGMCDRQEDLAVDPCALTSYTCRDMRTALKCGTIFYCQKFAWKRRLHHNFL